MGKIKIHEIAKKLGLTSKEVIEKATELKIDAKTHMSGVSEEDAKRIEDSFGGKSEKSSEKNVKKAKIEEEKAPVIIRREVIISDNEQAKKKEEKPIIHILVLQSYNLI